MSGRLKSFIGSEEDSQYIGRIKMAPRRRHMGLSHNLSLFVEGVGDCVMNLKSVIAGG